MKIILILAPFFVSQIIHLGLLVLLCINGKLMSIKKAYTFFFILFHTRVLYYDVSNKHDTNITLSYILWDYENEDDDGEGKYLEKWYMIVTSYFLCNIFSTTWCVGVSIKVFWKIFDKTLRYRVIHFSNVSL